ncbi:MAG: hypothetical protein D6732_28560 [Methanobacteriota archaeon]|nr:MAG: hypothetical protein D6732_28560 [Euryarchaeota archaeon]
MWVESNSEWVKWNISMLQYELNKRKQQIAETYSIMWGWNLSGSTPGNYSTLGQEEAVMLDDGTRATYDYLGEGSSVGAGANASAYLGVIANLETPDQYKGVATAVGATVSVGDVGLTVGYFWDSSKPPLTPGNVQGIMVGYAPGASASVWNSISVYNLTWQNKQR